MEIIHQLENKIRGAVEKINYLQNRVRELEEEKKVYEEKFQQLLQNFEQMDDKEESVKPQSLQPPQAAQVPEPPAETFHQQYHESEHSQPQESYHESEQPVANRAPEQPEPLQESQPHYEPGVDPEEPQIIDEPIHEQNETHYHHPHE
ncbi:MAG: cell division protein ZapB [Deltaproteobacteria bacterium]|nr:cell division protein ZapB [Deltaproteobacteria bacterium]